MKKMLLITATLLASAVAHTQAPNAWTQKANVDGTAHTSAVGFSIGNKGYIGTGYDENGLKRDFWEYNPDANTWTQKADFGGIARYWAVGFSIGSKGYIGTGYDGSSFKRDFWEYDPATNTWSQKVDFGGTARRGAVGFSIESKGYIGTGFDGSSFKRDFWEYDPATNTWSQKVDFGGTARHGAVGFSIESKGYVGTGFDEDSYHYKHDFWEYNPANNTWVQKADFGGTDRYGAVGFSIGSKGYIGTGWGGTFLSFSLRDFWEYESATDTWMQKADFAGTSRYEAVGLSIDGKGYIGNGFETSFYQMQDFWEFTPANTCPVPSNLRVPKISDICARLNWNVPGTLVEHIKVSYRPLGSNIWIEDRKKAGENSKIICGLAPNTTYEWKVRNICADDKTKWVKGPNFTTLSPPAFSSNTESVIDSKARGNATVQIMPNPNKGDFILRMQLPAKSASTTLSLYNNFGATVWQQNAGRLGGLIRRNISLENKLSASVYVLQVQHGDIRIMQKVVVVK